MSKIAGLRQAARSTIAEPAGETQAKNASLLPLAGEFVQEFS
jgi:hypothetical protein